MRIALSLKRSRAVAIFPYSIVCTESRRQNSCAAMLTAVREVGMFPPFAMREAVVED